MPVLASAIVRSNTQGCSVGHVIAGIKPAQFASMQNHLLYNHYTHIFFIIHCNIHLIVGLDPIYGSNTLLYRWMTSWSSSPPNLLSYKSPPGKELDYRFDPKPPLLDLLTSRSPSLSLSSWRLTNSWSNKKRLKNPKTDSSCQKHTQQEQLS